MNLSPVFDLPPLSMDLPAKPSMADLILRLRLSLRRDGDSYRRSLLDQLMSVTAEMEDRLAEQDERIRMLSKLRD